MWMAGAVALSVSVGAAAQNSQAPSNTQTKPTQNAASTVAVTGCVQRVNGQFILANARMVNRGSQGSQGSGGARGSTGSASTGSSSTGSTPDGRMSTYMLTANTTDMHNHVGHQVAIVGRIDASSTTPAATSGTTGTGSTGSGGVGASAGSSSSGTATSTSSAKTMGGSQVLEVQSVEMLASTCSTR
jgi:hypothetical protein